MTIAVLESGETIILRSVMITDLVTRALIIDVINIEMIYDCAKSVQIGNQNCNDCELLRQWHLLPEGTRRAGSTEGAICSQLLARDPGPLFDHFEKDAKWAQNPYFFGSLPPPQDAHYNQRIWLLFFFLSNMPTFWTCFERSDSLRSFEFFPIFFLGIPENWHFFQNSMRNWNT